MIEGDLGSSDGPNSPVETTTQDRFPFKPTVCDGVSVRGDRKSLRSKHGLPEMSGLDHFTARDEKVDVPNCLTAVGLIAEGNQLCPSFSG